MLGRPRAHFRVTDSTNTRAKELAAAGAPHGALVTADEQTAGRGRHGRTWVAPVGAALLCSLVLREHDDLLTLRAGLAVSDVAGGQVKWPNDVWLDGRKVAGVLAEGRPGEGWVVLGIGVNVRAAPEGIDAAALGRDDLEEVLAELVEALALRLAQPRSDVLAALRERDVLLGRSVTWGSSEGIAAGISDAGGLRVTLADGTETELSAGEVHLTSIDE